MALAETERESELHHAVTSIIPLTVASIWDTISVVEYRKVPLTSREAGSGYIIHIRKIILMEPLLLTL